MYRPLRSLREGHWFKLICGASFQHLPAIRNLTLAYTLAGADCIDVAADPAVIRAAKNALDAAVRLRSELGGKGSDVGELPWLMVSLNDGEDPHFRKAEFNPAHCPPHCDRPCERICPASAIVFDRPSEPSGVVENLCYGCGRCLPICPIGHIVTRSYGTSAATIAPLVLKEVDAVEIHTQVGRMVEFERLWRAIAPFASHLKLVAVSCPDGEGVIEYLTTLYELLSPLPCPVVWQTDGRPMSGDIGDGTTRAAVKLGQKVLAARLPGYVQLAGGTNSHTVSKLRTLGLLNPQRFTPNSLQADPSYQSTPLPRYIAGVAYGSYARVLLSPVLDQLEQMTPHSDLMMSQVEWSPFTADRNEGNSVALVSSAQVARLEDHPTLLWQAVHLANTLVSQLKSPMTCQLPDSDCVLP